MSTITKLDHNVRLDRHLRRLQLREMQGDLKTIQSLINRGHRITPSEEAKATHRRIMADMILKRAILEMTLNHLRKIARDPRRTGERKDAIFTKLGAEPESSANNE